jgi:hypothetical protein
MAAATDWWVVVPPSEVNASKVPADAKIISAQVGSSIDNSLLNQSTISYGGTTYTRYMGPFTSEAAAKSATPSTSVSILDLVKLGLGGAEAVASSGATAGGNDPSASTGDVLPSLPSWNLVVSGISGWFMRGLKIVIGSVLIISGIMRLSGKDKDVIQMATKAAQVGVFA